MKHNLEDRRIQNLAIEARYDGGKVEIWGPPVPVRLEDTPQGVKVNTFSNVQWDVSPNSNLILNAALTDPSNEATADPHYILVISADGLAKRLLTARMAANNDPARAQAQVVITDPTDPAALDLKANRALNVNSLTMTEFAGYV